ncbi:protein screw [Episyrphus balteatus]|uniref:protein screw n=1 Tax=Episyrphus balteatus TaxID=286459 RepID=UPI002485FCA7|nr:protein screw [Episyrphus balteatus]
MIFKVFIFLILCGVTTALTNILADSPYFLDERLQQSVVMKSLDSSENEFQFEMADLLGLNERPRSIKKPLSLKKSASKFLLELYNSITEEENPHTYSHHNRVARSTFVNKEDRSVIENCNNIITFSSKKSRTNRKQNKSHMTVIFNTNNVPEDLQLVRAELRIFQNSNLARKFEYERNVTVSVFHRLFNRKLQKIDLRLLNSFTTTTSYNGWLEANVTKTIAKWLLKGFTPNGHELIISTRLTGMSNEVLADNDENITPKDIGLVDESGNEENQPFIIGYFNGPELLNKIQHLRVKRDIGKKKIFSSDYSPAHHTEGESYKIPKNCERMNFSIDFKDLQMQDWVIAPKKFEAYFCGGDCNFPLGAKMNATNHAIVQTLMHLKQPNLPKPCCVPTVLGSISILHYLNEDSVNLSKYPNSVAKSCGCL